MQKKLDFEKLVLIAGGHTAFQLLWSAVRLEVFDELSKRPGQTLDEMCQSIGLKRYPCRVLMVGLAALGLVVKQGEQYFNDELSDQLLVTGKPGYIAPIFGWQADIVYPGMMNFVDSLRAGSNLGLQGFPGPGNTLYERLTVNKPVEKTFQDAMSALSKQANSHLLEAYDFGRYRHVVDAGGGDGTNAIALARKFPHLKLTVFDSESVCQIAARNISDHGLSDRISVWPGNFLEDPFPPDVDGILFCHIFTIWSMESEVRLLRKVHSALPDGGSVFIFNMMGDDDDTGPLSTALGSPYFLAIATGEGMLHSWSDYEGIIGQAGFAGIERVDSLPLAHGMIVGHK